MNADPNQLQTLPAVMTLAQWQKAELAAKQAVKSNLKPPQISSYVDAQISKHPRRLVMAVVTMLVVIIAGSFLVSAGKQIVAYDTILAHLASYSRLSASWVSISLIAAVLLSEVGAFCFSLAGAMFGSRTLRVAALLSASLAILANVAVTASYDYGSVLMTLLAWFITLFVPVVVLIGAFAGEKFVLEYLDRRERAKVEYEVARREYASAISYPERHPEYPSYLRRYWLETYRKMLKSEATILDNPETVNQMMARDFTFYMAPNFLQPPSLADNSKTALHARN